MMMARYLIISIEFPPGPGGIGNLAYQIASKFSTMGDEVHIATPQNHASQPDVIKFNNQQPFIITQFKYKGAFLVESIVRLIITLIRTRQFHPDCIIAIGRQAVWLGALISWMTGIPVVVICNGTEFLYKHRLFVKYSKWAYASANLAIMISNYTQKLALNEGYKFNKIVVIHLGADETIFQPAPRDQIYAEKLGIRNDKVILTVGQVSERKSQDVVIRALPIINSNVPHVDYLVVGLPTLQARLHALAVELGVSDQVIFTGKVAQADLPVLYNLADIFVLVSRQTHRGDVEGFGLVVMEAALCGLPAIVSQNSGLVEAVIPGETALVVLPDDPKALAEACISLLSNDQKREDMGIAALRFARTTGTWDIVIHNIREAITKAISSGSD